MQTTRTVNFEKLDRLSFRDPMGSVFSDGEKIFRTIAPIHQPAFFKLLLSPTLSEWVREGKLVGANVLEGEARPSSFSQAPGVLTIGHPKVAFPSYPHEWCPGMLQEAGRLTLQISKTLLKERIGLKDANAYNVLFQGPNPIFVDWLSFEPIETPTGMWLPYAQFMRQFVNPLLLRQATAMRLQNILQQRRDGISEEEVFRLLNPLQRLLPRYFFNVSLPTWLSRKAKTKELKVLTNPKALDAEKADFFLNMTFNRLERVLNSSYPRPADSEWSSYAEGRKGSYSDQELSQKTDFVSSVLQRTKPKRTLDVGCNTGFFSRLAAKAGSSVVSIDYDEDSIEATWKSAKAQGLDILPLVVDLARPTPAMGWRNREERSFLTRASGQFDCVLGLAVVHHLIVTNGIAFEEVCDLFAELTNDRLILEYVGPNDPMFRIIARGRDHGYFTLGYFKKAVSARFETLSEKRLSDSRTVLELKKLRTS